MPDADQTEDYAADNLPEPEPDEDELHYDDEAGSSDEEMSGTDEGGNLGDEAAEDAGAGEQEPQLEQEAFVMPEKFKGKSQEEIARSYAELEQMHGQTANKLRQAEDVTNWYDYHHKRGNIARWEQMDAQGQQQQGSAPAGQTEQGLNFGELGDVGLSPDEQASYSDFLPITDKVVQSRMKTIMPQIEQRVQQLLQPVHELTNTLNTVRDAGKLDTFAREQGCEADVKQALESGAIDMLLRHHPSLSRVEAFNLWRGQTGIVAKKAFQKGKAASGGPKAPKHGGKTSVPTPADRNAESDKVLARHGLGRDEVNEVDRAFY